MTAKEFLKTLNLPKNWSGEDEEYGQWLFYEKNVIEAMEQYHQSKVNSVVLDDVIKCDKCGSDDIYKGVEDDMCNNCNNFF